MSDDRAAKIAINTVSFMSPVLFQRLIKAFGSAVQILGTKDNGLTGVEGVSPKMARSIVELEPEKIVEKEEAYADKIGASIYTSGEPGYPEELSNVFSPPPVISIAGEIRYEDKTSIAVVGARNASLYGKLVTEKLVAGLAEKGVTVVSGLARGVDGIAHRMAIGRGGRTIAVLGCGLNIYYPPEHRSLQKKIVEHGAVVSQFSFTQGPEKMTFPMRNRVISGLSLGVLVIEAGEKSGALITAYAALDDNRDVFAVPGPINSPKSVGTNRLIKKGSAKLVQNVDDIIEELPDYILDNLKGEQSRLPIEGEEKLTHEEEKIMAIMDPHEPRHIDHFIRGCGLPTNSVSAILLALELKGKVKQFAGKLFIQC